MNDDVKSVVVTGASSGIGYAICKVLIENGIQVFGSVRTESDAKRLSNDFGKRYVPLIFDITDEKKVKEAAIIVREKLINKTLWGLVNNAGIAVPFPLLYLTVKDFEKQLQVNLTGHLIVTQAFAPLLGADTSLNGKPGKIINISSVAGKISHPFLGAYSVSKHGMEAFSDTLRVELSIFGIDVVVIAPGAIESKIWEKAEQVSIPKEIENSIYRDPVLKLKNYMLTTAAKNSLPAEVIGNLVLKILKAKRPKLRYAPVPQKFLNWTLPNLLPKRLFQWIIAKNLGLLKK